MFSKKDKSGISMRKVNITAFESNILPTIKTIYHKSYCYSVNNVMSNNVMPTHYITLSVGTSYSMTMSVTTMQIFIEIKKL